MDGVLNILKPPGMTSHDVVDFVRGAYETRKVGHAGTLDPGAAGVLVVCVGRATRIVQFLTDADKSYRAELTLGLTTDTQDSDGAVVGEADASHITEAEAREAVAALLDVKEMVPPMHSAVRHKGQKLYELARAGKVVEREARAMEIKEACLVRMTPGGRPRILFDVTCSKGTYVRTLCALVGERLGCGAHMSFLLRTRVGRHRLADAKTLESIASADADERESLLEGVAEALGDLPRVDLSEGEASRLSHGGQVIRTGPDVEGSADDGRLVRGHGPDGNLVCVARREARPEGVCLRPVRVLSS